MGDGFDNQRKKAFQKVTLGYDANHSLLIVEVAEGKEIGNYGKPHMVKLITKLESNILLLLCIGRGNYFYICIFLHFSTT